jgi:hypothetical protein
MSGSRISEWHANSMFCKACVAHWETNITYTIGSDIPWAVATLLFAVLLLRFAPLLLGSVIGSCIFGTCHEHVSCTGWLSVTLFGPHRRIPNPSRLSNFVLQYFLLQFLPEYHLMISRAIVSSSNSIVPVDLRNRTEESKLPMGPPFCSPNILQTNRSMPAIVHIIHPVLWSDMVSNGFCIIELTPLPVLATPPCVLIIFCTYLSSLWLWTRNFLPSISCT